MSRGSRQVDFVELLTQHQHRLFAYLFALLHNTADADDVYQQTAMRLWDKFDTFDLETDFFRWSSKFAQYEALNFLKTQRRRQAHFSDTFVAELATFYAEFASTPQDDRRDALSGCLEKLSATDRELIGRRYLDSQSVEELAAQLERSAKGIYNALGRIRRALLECVERSLSS